MYSILWTEWSHPLEVEIITTILVIKMEVIAHSSWQTAQVGAPTAVSSAKIVVMPLLYWLHYGLMLNKVVLKHNLVLFLECISHFSLPSVCAILFPTPHPSSLFHVKKPDYIIHLMVEGHATECGSKINDIGCLSRYDSSRVFCTVIYIFFT